MKAISLFSGGGIGDLALKRNGIRVILANELIAERAQVFMHNHPSTRMLVGDINERKQDIIDCTKQLLGTAELGMVFATPPCQGMSKNGMGKLLNLARKGQRPTADPRNLLVIPTLEIFIALGAETLVMENVPEMKRTCIPDNENKGRFINILDYIKRCLGQDYYSQVEVVEFADYGVPQRRQRLISIFTKNKALKARIQNGLGLFSEPTHAKVPIGKLPWVSVKDAIGALPPLDASSKEKAHHPTLDYHRVPLLDEAKYLWVSNTPANKSAFDNQCANKACLFDGNLTHRSVRNEKGINRASLATPIYCENCNELLPRPWVKIGTKYRLMKGYTSAYKRMNFDLPASALTRNLSYACSDNKLHPKQNRVLSLHEAMILQTISRYDFQWVRADDKKVSDKLVREIIGESVPPLGLDILLSYLMEKIDGTVGEENLHKVAS